MINKTTETAHIFFEEAQLDLDNDDDEDSEDSCSDKE